MTIRDEPVSRQIHLRIRDLEPFKCPQIYLRHETEYSAQWGFSKLGVGTVAVGSDLLGLSVQPVRL